MPTIDTRPLSASQARELDNFLKDPRHPQGTLNLMSLWGYLFGVCTTPRMLSPSAWLPGIFVGELAAEGSPEDIQYLQSIMQLYNQINDEVQAANCKLPKGCELPADVREAFVPGSGLHDWCSGFSYSLSLFQSVWQELEDQKLLSVDDDEEMPMPAFWLPLTLFGISPDSEPMRELLEEVESLEQLARETRKNFNGIMNSYAFMAVELYHCLLEDGKAFANMDGQGFVSADFDDFPQQIDEEQEEFEDLLEMGYETDDRELAAEAARRALELRPDSLDALNLLAGTELNPTRKVAMLEEAIAATEAEWGPEFFTDHAGHFWGVLETRPYMRSLASMADACYESGQMERAIAHYERCLELNPNDNQGIRNVIIARYFEAQRLDRVADLLDQCPEQSAFILYSRALLSYIREGDSPTARQHRKEAVAYNKHVPKLLAGHSKMPQRMPDYHGFGDKDEAVLFVSVHQKAWRQAAGSVGWLLKK